MEVVRHSDRCMIKSMKNSHTVEAVVMDFLDKKHLNVVINNAVKLHMTWNGRVYEGRASGLDFESAGPQVQRSTTGIRG